MSYGDYGGREIQFLYASFEQFFADLGPRPPGTTLDRIDNDDDYKVGNCKWSTLKEQAANKRRRVQVQLKLFEARASEKNGRARNGAAKSLERQPLRKDQHMPNISDRKIPQERGRVTCIDFGRLQERDRNYGLPVECYVCGAPHEALGLARITEGEAVTHVPLCEACRVAGKTVKAIARKYWNVPT